MAKFKVFQFQLSDEDTDLVNAKGWDASDKLKAYMDVRFGKWAPVAHKYYDEVAEIETDSLRQVFEIGNGYGDQSALVRKAPMHSVSVGDIIMAENGDMSLVSMVGFTKI